VTISTLPLICSAFAAPAGDSAPPPGHPTLPKDHPTLKHQPVTSFDHPKSGANYTLDIPPEVRTKWRAVRLTVHPAGRTEQTERVPIGSKIELEGTGLQLYIVAFVPAFQSNAGVVTSSANTPDNPALLVELIEGEKKLASGWVFQNLPAYNTFTNDKVKVRLLAGLTAGK